VGSRAVLDVVVKRKISSPRRESNPRTPIFQPVAQRYTGSPLSFMLHKLNETESYFALGAELHLFFISAVKEEMSTSDSSHLYLMPLNRKRSGPRDE
jgi:hypothetical protein